MMQAQIEQHISYTSSSYHEDSPQTDCAKVNKISRKSCIKHKLTQGREQLYHFDVYNHKTWKYNSDNVVAAGIGIESMKRDEEQMAQW